MGFYKYFENELFYAPNFVYGPNYTLIIEKKNEYIFPVDGWYYFNSKEDANLFFNII